jgi:hypothetical protein
MSQITTTTAAQVEHLVKRIHVLEEELQRCRERGAALQCDLDVARAIADGERSRWQPEIAQLTELVAATQKRVGEQRGVIVEIRTDALTLCAAVREMIACIDARRRMSGIEIAPAAWAILIAPTIELLDSIEYYCR